MITPRRPPSIIESFNYAIEGIIHVLRTQRNMRIHFAVAVVVLVAALVSDVSRLELIALFIAIAFVLIAEMINTAIEAAVDVASTTFDPMAKLAKDIGSPGVKVRPNGLPKGVPEAKTLEQIGKALAECAAFAVEHGVTIQLEVHGPETARLPRIRKILDHAGNHPGLRVCWNSNQDDLLDGGFDAAFALVRDQIGQVHMRDLFLAEYPWRRLITSLVAMKFDGYCFAEIPESADPIRTLKYFRTVFRAYQGL